MSKERALQAEKKGFKIGEYKFIQEASKKGRWLWVNEEASE